MATPVGQRILTLTLGLRSGLIPTFIPTLSCGDDHLGVGGLGRVLIDFDPEADAGKGDYAFVLQMVETMKPKTGRVAVVAPYCVLFRGAAEGKIRQKLVEENLIDAVIGLPEKLFYGTGIPAAILVLRRNKTDKNILFIDAAREFISGKNQNQLSDENIKKVIETYRACKSVDKYAYLAGPQELAENDFNLNIPRYVDTFEEEDEIDLMAVRDERKKLKAELADLEEKMDGYLKELGYAV